MGSLMACFKEETREEETKSTDIDEKISFSESYLRIALDYVV
jgi:hypothetical protein